MQAFRPVVNFTRQSGMTVKRHHVGLRPEEGSGPMFLRTAPNPHDEGRPARVVRFKQDEERVFAIDADELHRNPRLLNSFSRLNEFRIRALDFVAYTILVLFVIASFAIAWWLIIPGLAACVFMIAINRKLAGEVAMRAARKSTEAFLYLHTIGVLWLIQR